MVNRIVTVHLCVAGKDGNRVTTVVATPGQGSDKPHEVSYSDTKVSQAIQGRKGGLRWGEGCEWG